jgi:hypothetical protein
MPPPEKLTFRDMTFEILESRYGIREGRRRILFEGGLPEITPSATLVENLRRARSAVMVNERSRAYRLVAPVLSELEEQRRGKIMTFPEVSLEAEGVEGLRGNPDFIISGSLTPRLVPIVAIVEAKKDDTEPGLPQCIAELYASYLINRNRPGTIHGCVTTGYDWQFVQLDGGKKIAHVDTEVYLIAEPAKLLGVLGHIVDAALAELPELAAEP